MIHGYSEDYLDRVMRNLGKMFDLALRQEGIDADSFEKFFKESFIAKGIYKGDVFILIGKSGQEYLIELLDKEIEDIDPLYPPGKEYWVGYVLGYIQWYWYVTFDRIFNAISLSELMGLYNPYHEADISKITDLVGARLDRNGILKRKRKELGITQKELAESTGISLPTIRAYEQGELELSKAQGESLYRLSRTLHCTIEELLLG